jgi:hypothetical protein
MNVPGFTADCSLYTKKNAYYAACIYRNGWLNSSGVSPQQSIRDPFSRASFGLGFWPDNYWHYLLCTLSLKLCQTSCESYLFNPRLQKHCECLCMNEWCRCSGECELPLPIC